MPQPMPVPFPDLCGTPSVNHSFNLRVVGGDEAVPHSWPWTVPMFFLTQSEPACGASIISDMWLLCAAHCYAE